MKNTLKEAEDIYIKFVEKLSSIGVMYDDPFEKRIFFYSLNKNKYSLEKDILKMKKIIKSIDENNFNISMLD